jgi:hypothetical protein
MDNIFDNPILKIIYEVAKEESHLANIARQTKLDEFGFRVLYPRQSKITEYMPSEEDDALRGLEQLFE